MNMDALIESLSRDVPPVSRHSVRSRLILGIAVGGAITVALIVMGLGIRPDLYLAMRGWSFWMKWAYTLSLGICAIVATARLARPDATLPGWLWLLALPVTGLAIVGAVEMAYAPPADWMAMWLGHSWRICPAIVFLLSLPIFVGLLWSFRHFAPTRLRAAGATAGLAAGAWAAMLYCLHCPEVSAIFVLTWYTLGIALSSLVGALLGPRLLRW